MSEYWAPLQVRLLLGWEESEGKDLAMHNAKCLEHQTTIYKWLFQLDDSQSLHRKWLFHQTSIHKWLFGVPGVSVLKLRPPQIKSLGTKVFHVKA